MIEKLLTIYYIFFLNLIQILSLIYTIARSQLLIHYVLIVVRNILAILIEIFIEYYKKDFLILKDKVSIIKVQPKSYNPAWLKLYKTPTLTM